MIDEHAKAHLHEHLRWVREQLDGSVGVDADSAPLHGRDRSFWDGRRAEIEHIARVAKS